MAVALLSTGAAMAQDGDVRNVSFEAGTGEKVGMIRLGLQGKLPYRWLERDGKHLGTYWDASVAYWRASRFENIPGRRQDIVNIGYTPVLRYAASNGRGWYVEGGIGVHLLSELYDNNQRRLSTAFQFGDHLGGGFVYDNGWDLGFKLQHFSNGSIKQPNYGVNFLVIKLARPF